MDECMADDLKKNPSQHVKTQEYKALFSKFDDCILNLPHAH